MSSRFAFGHNPHSTGHVISTARALMRADGLDVSLAAIARDCGITRNFLYANWKSVSALHLHALKAEPQDWMHAGTPTLAKLVLGSGLVAGAAAMILFYAALNLGEVSRIKPIAFAVAPAVGALLGWLVLGESMGVRKAVGILAILAGVVILTGRSAASVPDGAGEQASQVAESAPKP